MHGLVAIQILVKDRKHGDMPDACVIELLEREARFGQLGKQPFTGVIPQHASPGDIAGELKASAEYRPCGAEAHGIWMMRVDRSTVASERRVPLRSASFFVNKLTRANDDLMQE